MKKRWALVLLALPLAGCGMVTDPAPPKVAETTVCFNAYGTMLTQPLGVCPPCWYAIAPTDRMPLGTVDRCGR
jgi:hypothetical protein